MLFPDGLEPVMLSFMREYPSFVAGLRYKGRGHYCREHLKIGDLLVYRLEPNNPVDPDAVTISPAADPSAVIGYVPVKHIWIGEVIRDRRTIDAIVERIDLGYWLWWRRATFILLKVRVSEERISGQKRSHVRTPAAVG